MVLILPTRLTVTLRPVSSFRSSQITNDAPVKVTGDDEDDEEDEDEDEDGEDGPPE